ncbi:hypothetical protein EC973_006572 [Apophysomyces ossiformis]|uniref:Myb-like, SWIRM and MPN domain-containing protein 1 n=1 Tax=Apophysomyces ossiformis TaxID=679940 RepID=A0A8H7EQF1_9FUNG|nr:hypothetical protein EC973_006572 [Apophysomyces ossiformis]
MPPKKAAKADVSENEPLSKAQEEEMSSALIAKLLAEDAANGNDDYYAEYSNDVKGYDPYHGTDERDDSYEEESEDDYAPKRNGKGRGRGRPPKSNKNESSTGRRGRKRKIVTTEESTQDASSAINTEKPAEEGQTTEPSPAKSNEAKPVSKKPRKPVPEGYNTGNYSEEEEKRFLEGLELFGRDWTKLQAHIATRDANSIRSHAQKHLIKLFRDGIPLPEKVRETGEGYTLSGKPLDPNSAAAKPYLMRMGMCTETPKTTAVQKPAETVQDSSTETSPKETSNEDIQKFGNATKDAGSSPKASDVLPSKPSPPAVQSQDSPKIKKRKQRSRSSSVERVPSAYDESGRTNYSKLRLRQPRDRTSVNHSQLGKDDITSDPLTMVKCEPFIGKPGSDTSGSQPFQILVHSNVLLSMDFHAHLMTTEIIGFLAGEWDKQKMLMTVKKAYPCRSLNTGHNEVNVEMDPTSAIETRQLIEENNMKVVGWYHSHPTFIPDPSLVDIENQRNYQILCRDECLEGNQNKTVEPFVGAIVGPYDPRLPGSASVINWFYVGDSRHERAIPKRLIYDLQEDECVSDEEADRLFNLLEVYKESEEKVDFSDRWRRDIQESKLAKLIKSLGMRMPWIQNKLRQQPMDEAMSTTGEDEKSSENQTEAESEDSIIIDPFLEKVQARLKDW